jgi:hypothetical protein
LLLGHGIKVLLWRFDERRSQPRLQWFDGRTGLPGKYR